VRASNGPGAVACVGDIETTYFHEAIGLRQRIPVESPAESTTLYDLASLTKVIATTTVVLLLRDEGLIDLDQPVSDIVPVSAFDAFSIRQLLTHTAGLVPMLPLYESVNSVDAMIERFAERGIEAPSGTRHRYSDAGFIILGRIVELIERDSLDRVCAQRIFDPLDMGSTRFNPPADWADRCAATEDCPWRGRVVVGAVHDENAYAVGGVAGHAGLFSNAPDLARFCRALLGGRLLAETTLEEMLVFGQVPSYPWQGLGWKLDAWHGGVEGFLPSRQSFGHTGWTGTCLWMDRASGRFAILLGNTCHPSRQERDNRAFRQIFFGEVARQLYPRTTNTHTGVDRLVWDRFQTLRRTRVALLTNRAATDVQGQPTCDVFAGQSQLALVRLYGPEHGIEIQAEAGEAVNAKKSTVPVTSLYGTRKEPSRAELKEIDLFVIDLPDVGARYYTYMATLLACMKACAEARKPILVLDRPNPLGGAVLEGPIAERVGADVCCAPIPIRHGMTLGEAALFLRETTPALRSLHLEVSTLDGWYRDRLFNECSLQWIPPSPNIPTPETALVYVGTCLFEGTNVNEGRGTDTPFLTVGAPWLDAEAVIQAINPEDRPGCSIEAVTYTPESLPGKATHPRYLGEQCAGLRVHLRDAHRVRAFTMAVAMLAAIRARHPSEFEWSPFFDVLAGGDALRKAIESGRSAREITLSCALELDRFDQRRPRLYHASNAVTE